MTRRLIAFLTTTILVLCAGVVVGRLTMQMPVLTTPGGEHSEHNGQGPSWIAQQLGLSTQQRAQMDAIWADARQKMEQSGEKRHEVDRAHDAAVQAILSDSQKAEFEKVNADYHAQRTALEKDRGMLIGDAEKRSRDLLDETQQKKYDELTKQMHNQQTHNHRGPRRSGASPDTQPATQPE
jgi:Spy/CpxP family protein refolding chaperone